MENLQKLTALGNVQRGADFILCTLNPKIYALDIIYSAAYILIDKAYIVLDGDPEVAVKVEIRKKASTPMSLEELAVLFNEELLNYAVYKVQHERNKGIREIILQRALLTNAPLTILEKMRESQKQDESTQKTIG